MRNRTCHDNLKLVTSIKVYKQESTHFLTENLLYFKATSCDYVPRGQ